MDRHEFIECWVNCCDTLLRSLRCGMDSQDEINKIHQQLDRFISTGLLPWEHASEGDPFANFAMSPPVIQETRVSFCPTPQATNSAVSYGTL